MVTIISRITTGRGQVVKGDVFIFPKGEKLTAEDLQGFLAYQQLLYDKR